MNKGNQPNSSKWLTHRIRIALSLMLVLFCLYALLPNLRPPFGALVEMSSATSLSALSRQKEKVGQMTDDNGEVKEQSGFDGPIAARTNLGSTPSSPKYQQSRAYGDTALIDPCSDILAGSCSPGNNLGNRIPVILIHGIHGNQTSFGFDTTAQPNTGYFYNLVRYLNNPATSYNIGFKTYWTLAKTSRPNPLF